MKSIKLATFTRGEEQILQIVWQLGDVTVRVKYTLPVDFVLTKSADHPQRLGCR